MEDKNTGDQNPAINDPDGSCSSSGKRKSEEQASGQQTQFKKARFPWQIKGVSVERNIISREVTIDENNPEHMVGLLHYEEKGVVEIDLSNSASSRKFLSSADATSSTSSIRRDEEENVYKTLIAPSLTQPAFSNDDSDSNIDLDGEHESSMDHEVSHIHSLREAMIGNNPAANFQQCVWQKREMGCAIVDNVFNKTLEEMGLSPDPKVNQFATDRLHILQQGIDAAINQQGLLTQSGHTPGTNRCNRTTTSEAGQHSLMKRRLSLEDIPSSSANSKRRLSQPLSGYDLKWKGLGSESSNNEQTSATNTNNAFIVETGEDMNNNNDMESFHTDGNGNMMITNSNESAIDTNSGQTSYGHEQCDDTNMQKSTLNEEQNLQITQNDSDELLDLAVSTVIESQGLTL